MKFFIAIALIAVVAARPDVSLGPAIIDSFLPESAPPSSPLVQIIVNVKDSGSSVGPNPVVVEGLEKPKPNPIPKPTPVIVVEEAEVEPIIVVDDLPFPELAVVPEPVIVAPELGVPELVVAPEPVVVAPIIVAPVVSAPDTLN